jgi:hypothetical protein
MAVIRSETEPERRKRTRPNSALTVPQQSAKMMIG